jgi:hypothetical protein
MKNPSITNLVRNALFQLLEYDEYIQSISGGTHWITADVDAEYPCLVVSRMPSIDDDLQQRTFTGEWFQPHVFRIQALAHGDRAYSTVTEMLDHVDDILRDWQGDDDVHVVKCRRLSRGPDMHDRVQSRVVVGDQSIIEIWVRPYEAA